MTHKSSHQVTIRYRESEPHFVEVDWHPAYDEADSDVDHRSDDVNLRLRQARRLLLAFDLTLVVFLPCL